MKKVIWLAIMASLILLGACTVTTAPAPETPTPQTPTPTQPTTIASLSEAAITKQVDSSSRPVGEFETFFDDIQEIYCCVKLSNAEENTKVKIVWQHVRDEGGSTTDQKIREEVVTKSGTIHLHFSLGQPFSGWPLGDYEARLYLNENQEMAIPFSITAAPPESKIKMLKVLQISATTDANEYHAHGTVMNVGNTILEGVQIEVTFLDEYEIVLKTVTASLEPSTIAVREQAEFYVRTTMPGKGKYFDYRFILLSGEEIQYEVPSK